ncbi:MAG: hypothetical protein AB8E82_05685 [Aureispira sp.]
MKNVSNSPHSEEFIDSSEGSLSNSQATPKNYEQAVERVTQALEQERPTGILEKLLFGIGLIICVILVIPLLLEFFSYPSWLEVVYDFSIFVEASLPLIVSFFLKNKQQATILRIGGTIVLLTYILTYS